MRLFVPAVSLTLWLAAAASAGAEPATPPAPAPVSPASAPGLDNLLANSPFSRAKTAGAADAANQPFEFRAVLDEGGRNVFSVYDTATKRSRWVALNDATDDYVVKEYDAARQTLVIDQKGRQLAMALKSAPKVAQVAPVRPAGVPGAIPGLPGTGPTGPLPAGTGVAGIPGQPGPAAAPGKVPDSQRMQQIVEEIQRRRALRQQAPNPGTGPMPLPNGAPPAATPAATPNKN